eukprot:5129290-Karenia_brevis.AAC.1
MKIFVTDDEETIPTVVQPDSTISSIKGKLEVLLDIPSHMQELVFADFPLMDEQTLNDANIQHRSTLHLRKPAPPPGIQLHPEIAGPPQFPSQSSELGNYLPADRGLETHATPEAK